MSKTPFKSARVRNAVKGALGTAAAVPLLFAALPASADIGDTTFDISGYVKLDSVYDFEADRGVSLTPSMVIENAVAKGAGVGDGGYGEKDGALAWTARQTRLILNTTTPTAAGDVGGYLEFDMYGNRGGGGDLRMRQGFLTWNGWKIGRAWSTFSNFHYGTLLNFGDPTGPAYMRTEQITYTMDLGNGNNFAIGLENADAVRDTELTGTPPTGINNGVLGSRQSNTRLPALAMRYQGNEGIFSYQAAGYLTSIQARNLSGSKKSKAAWGINLGGTASLDSGTTLSLSAAYGEGVGSMIKTPLRGVTGYINTNGDLKLAEELGVVASLGQQFTDQVSANLVYGYSRNEIADVKLKGHSVSANLLYSPVDPLVFGVEYTYVRGKIDIGSAHEHANGNQLQFSAIYNF